MSQLQPSVSLAFSNAPSACFAEPQSPTVTLRSTAAMAGANASIATPIVVAIRVRSAMNHTVTTSTATTAGNDGGVTGGTPPPTGRAAAAGTPRGAAGGGSLNKGGWPIRVDFDNSSVSVPSPLSNVSYLSACGTHQPAGPSSSLLSASPLAAALRRGSHRDGDGHAATATSASTTTWQTFSVDHVFADENFSTTAELSESRTCTPLRRSQVGATPPSAVDNIAEEGGVAILREADDNASSSSRPLALCECAPSTPPPPRHLGGHNQPGGARDVPWLPLADVVNASCAPQARNSQERVFETLGVPLVTHVCSGMNATLLAYGQTGSGKTHTVYGTPTDAGLTHRMLQRLCEAPIDAMATTGAGGGMTAGDVKKRHRQLEVSLLEIYNEKVRDLLLAGPTAQTSSVAGPMGSFRDVKVRFHPEYGTYVEGLTRVPISNFEQCATLIRQGQEQRSVANTLLNATSSRSHAILQVTVRTPDPMRGSQKVAILNLVDLAGSERVRASGVQGRHFTEAAKINLSLTNLRRVIDALIVKGGGGASSPSSSSMVVPYRDSLLTWLLADCLGGNSRTCFVATVHYDVAFLDDTIHTLRYAVKAKAVVCHVRVNERRDADAVRLLQDLINDLRRRLAMQQASGESVADRHRLSVEECDAVQRELAVREAEIAVMVDQQARMAAEHDKLVTVVKEKNDRLNDARAELERRRQVVQDARALEGRAEILRKQRDADDRQRVAYETALLTSLSTLQYERARRASMANRLDTRLQFIEQQAARQKQLRRERFAVVLRTATKYGLEQGVGNALHRHVDELRYTAALLTERRDELDARLAESRAIADIRDPPLTVLAHELESRTLMVHAEHEQRAAVVNAWRVALRGQLDAQLARRRDAAGEWDDVFRTIADVDIADVQQLDHVFAELTSAARSQLAWYTEHVEEAVAKSRLNAANKQVSEVTETLIASENAIARERARAASYDAQLADATRLVTLDGDVVRDQEVALLAADAGLEQLRTLLKAECEEREFFDSWIRRSDSPPKYRDALGARGSGIRIPPLLATSPTATAANGRGRRSVSPLSLPSLGGGHSLSTGSATLPYDDRRAIALGRGGGVAGGFSRRGRPFNPPELPLASSAIAGTGFPRAASPSAVAARRLMDLVTTAVLYVKRLPSKSLSPVSPTRNKRSTSPSQVT